MLNFPTSIARSSRQDSGAHCEGICEHVLESELSGPTCHGAWAPRDIGVYLKRETDAYRREPGCAASRRGTSPVAGVSRACRLHLATCAVVAVRCALRLAVRRRALCLLTPHVLSCRDPPPRSWGHYNEFLINGTHWDQHLPWSVEAFITSRTGASSKAYEAFMKKYEATGVTAADVSRARHGTRARACLLATLCHRAAAFSLRTGGAADDGAEHRGAVCGGDWVCGQRGPNAPSAIRAEGVGLKEGKTGC